MQAAIEGLESRKLLASAVTGIPAIMGTTGINPYNDVNSGAVFNDLNALNSLGLGTALLHLYPGQYCTSNLSQGAYDSSDDTAILDCYNQSITPTISFEYYTSGGYSYISNYPWTSIGQTFAARYEPGGTWDQAQHAINPNFNMSFGVTLFKAINEPDDDNPAMNASGYALALQDLASGVHSVNSSLDVVPAGFAYPNKSGQIPNQPLNSALQPLIDAIAPMLNDGTLAGIDLHTYADSQYDPLPGGFAWSAYSNFLKVKNDSVPKITTDIGFYCTEFDYHLSGSATAASTAQGLLTQTWDNLGVTGNSGEPVTQLALAYTLTETPAQDTSNGMAEQLNPWVGTSRAQTVGLVAQLTNGMSFVSANPATTGTYVLQDAAGDRKLWAWQDVRSWTNELGTSFTVSGIPSTAKYLDVYGWNGLREQIPLSGQTSYTVIGLPGSETYMLLATSIPALPSSWAQADIGSPSMPGVSTLINLTGGSTPSWNTSGGGVGVGGTSDQLHLTSQSFIGDGTLEAQVTGLSGGSILAQSGVIFRDSTATNAMYAATLFEPDNGNGAVVFSWRSSTGANANSTTYSFPASTASADVELVRSGNTFTGYYSTNGTVWTQAGSVQNIPVNQTAQAGLTVSSGQSTTLATASVSKVQLSSGLVDTDIGSPANAGSGSFASYNNTWNISGAGAGISGTSDQFNFASLNHSGGGTIIAEVSSLANYATTINAAAEAGVMFRAATTATDYNAAIFITPGTDSAPYGNGIVFQWRNSSGGASSVTVASSSAAPLASPIWLELVDTNNSFAGFYSFNGTSWTQAGSAVTVALAGSAQAGLAVSSNDNTSLVTAVFRNVSISGAPAAVTPAIMPDNLGAVSISAGGKLAVAPPDVHGDRSVLVASSLALATGSQLDLTSNDLIVHNGNTASVSTPGSIANLLAGGYANGAWNGSTGILSSAAAGNSTHLTALGYMTGGSTFDGITTTATDVLIKYTYYGDANLDGKVDGSDYSRIDSGYLSHLTGWNNGDFNDDGIVNGSDYTLIDNAFNTQNAGILASIATPVARIAPAASSTPGSDPAGSEDWWKKRIVLKRLIDDE